MRANGRATWQKIKSVFDSRNGFLVLLRSFLYITLCDNFSSSKSYSRNTLGKKVRHWGLNPWPPECPRGLEFNMNSIWLLQSPTELLVNSRWIQDLTFGDFSCCIKTDLSCYASPLNSTKWSYHVVIKFVLLSLIKTVHYQTYVKYQIKSPRLHFYFAGFLCITYCLCAYYCWYWLLRIWFGKTSPAGHQ